MPISAQQWRAAIGCFKFQCPMYKPVVTAEQAADVVLSLSFIVLMCTIYHCKMIYGRFVTLFQYRYALCMCCTHVFIALCLCYASFMCHSVIVWKVGILAYQMYLLIQYREPNVHVYELGHICRFCLCVYCKACVYIYNLYDFVLLVVSSVVYKLCLCYLCLLNILAFQIYCAWLLCKREWTKGWIPFIHDAAKEGYVPALYIFMLLYWHTQPVQRK